MNKFISNILFPARLTIDAANMIVESVDNLAGNSKVNQIKVDKPVGCKDDVSFDEIKNILQKIDDNFYMLKKIIYKLDEKQKQQNIN